MDLGTYIENKIEQALNNTVVPVLQKLVSAEQGDTGGGPGGPSESAMEQAAKAGADELVNQITPGESGGLVGILDHLLPFGISSISFINPLYDLFGKAGNFISGIALGWGLGSLVGEVMQPAGASVVYSAHRASGDGRMDPATAGRLWAKGIMTADQAVADAHDQGFANEGPNGSMSPALGRIFQYAEDALQFPDVADVLTLYNRGTIQLQDVHDALQRHGFPANWAGYLITLSQNLLSPADVALAHLRGFIDLPTAYAYAARLGVDQADMDTLIANTGEPPGLEELMSMTRRNIIDQPRFERGVRQSRVRDEWIGFLEEAMHEPMSIADAVRATVEKYISQDEGQRIATENGLLPEHFPILVEAWGRPLSPTEMARLYWRGLATQAQYEQAVRESDIKDKYVGQAFELARTLIPVRQVITALQHGVISHAEAISQLMMQGYTSHDAEIEVSLGQAEHHAALKELTKSDIQALYTDKLMTKDQATDKLVFLGYDKQVAEWILDLAEARHTDQLARALQAQVKALYQKHELTREEATDKLVIGGMAHENAHALLDEWDLVHKIPTRQLTEAQIIRAAKGGVIDVIHAGDMLVGIGYTERDAIILLQEQGLVEYTSTMGDHWKPPNPGELFGGH